MARVRYGRLAKATSAEEDPYLVLFAAIIKRCQRDLASPTRKRSSGGIYPSPREQQEADEFLQAMVESATRRTS